MFINYNNTESINTVQHTFQSQVKTKSFAILSKTTIIKDQRINSGDRQGEQRYAPVFDRRQHTLTLHTIFLTKGGTRRVIHYALVQTATTH